MIVPLLTYRGPVKLSYTKTQQDRFSSLERRAKEVIGRSVPRILKSVKKEALGSLLKRSLEEKKFVITFKNYFEIYEHDMATRNNGHLITLPKFKLELGKQSFNCSGALLVILCYIAWYILICFTENMIFLQRNK